MPARRPSVHAAAPGHRARHRRSHAGPSGAFRAYAPAATAVVAGLTGIGLVTALLSGPATFARADSPTPSAAPGGQGDVVALSGAAVGTTDAATDVKQKQAQALRAREIATQLAKDRAKALAWKSPVNAEWTRKATLAAQARKRDRQAALAWARGRTDAQARAAAETWARAFRAAGGRADQEAQAARILARVPAKATRLQAASMLKNTDRIGRRDGEWDNADRTVTKGTARAAAVMLLDDYGFDLTEWSCLDRLWWQESNWRWNAQGGQTYGIPQALPGSKMASAGADWATNPVTQIKWGLGYIKARYDTPCGAWRFWSANHWY